jgi:hypothetical protein
VWGGNRVQKWTCPFCRKECSDGPIAQPVLDKMIQCTVRSPSRPHTARGSPQMSGGSLGGLDALLRLLLEDGSFGSACQCTFGAPARSRK